MDKCRTRLNPSQVDFPMSACEMLTYNNVTNDAWNAIKSSVAQQHGINVNDNSGSATLAGFTLQWGYDSTKQVLAVQCTDHPFFVSCTLVQSQITTFIENCLGQHNVAVGPLVV